jgi:hypothetical protein
MDYLLKKKVVMLSPCDLPGSVMKGMQTEIGNLTTDIDKVLKAKQSYSEAVSQIKSLKNITEGISGIGDISGSLESIGDLLNQVDDSAEKIEALMEKYAPKLAKKMKVVMNKIGEFTSKTINKIIGPLADLQFPNMRFEFLNMKIKINEKLKCLFSKLANGLGKKILDALKNLFGGGNSQQSANPSPTSPTGAAPLVPMCSVEQLTGEILGSCMGDINKAAEEITQSVGTFMQDSQSGLPAVGNIGDIAGQVGGIAGQVGAAADKVAGIAGAVSGIAGAVGGLLGGFGNLKLGDIKFPDIGESIKAALSFENITLNLFGCDSKPNCPATDAFTLDVGGEAVPDPNKSEVGKKAGDYLKSTTDSLLGGVGASSFDTSKLTRNFDVPPIPATIG